MKIVAYEADGRVHIGAVQGDESIASIADIDAFWSSPGQLGTGAGSKKIPLSGLRLRPAVPKSARIICVGLNYRAHALESKAPIPTIPVIFGRWGCTLVVDGDPVPAMEEKFDWEGELGVVIGQSLFRVGPEEGLAGVFGYAAFNDLSCRSFQLQTSQWTLGKNSDRSGPMSAIVTADTVGDPRRGLRLMTRVNGETFQDSSTDDMIFSVGEIISHVSQVMTLEPGDLIVTGTPAGVGMARGKFLKPGDEVEVEIEKIGSVRTPIVAPASLAARMK
jgi:2-keto-4-pentenoate hydratase/2-oxohepta-3-ene-1,7-dioic acid hydratase in catechol pathway